MKANAWLACAVCLSLLGACSWENTAHELTRLPAYLDLQDRITVQNPPRWRLTGSTPVALIHHGPAPDPWQQAARRGLNQVMQTTDGAADVNLKVFWPLSSGSAADAPDPDRIAQHHVSASLLGLNLMPQPAAGQLLIIHAIDGQGTLMQSMQLQIDPKLWGDQWRHEDMIESAFAHLAVVLQGG